MEDEYLNIVCVYECTFTYIADIYSNHPYECKGTRICACRARIYVSNLMLINMHADRCVGQMYDWPGMSRVYMHAFIHI